jgi:hypothetical protein
MTDQTDRLKAALSDRYTIEREIGRSIVATVYLAEDLKQRSGLSCLGKVCGKVLLQTDAKEGKGMQREAGASQELENRREQSLGS